MSNCKCKNKRVCMLLGECLFEHSLIKHRLNARVKAHTVDSVKKAVALFNEFTDRRMILNSGRSFEIIYPGGAVKAQKISQKAKKAPIKQPPPVKPYSMPVLDPVTLRLYKARMKRQAEEDVDKGYAYQEGFVHINFHE